jgi:mRNA interferase RelE/StbE
VQTAFTHKFKKQVDSCKDLRIRKKLLSVIEEADAAESLSTIKNVKKMKGVSSSFQIRIGDYRVGIVLDKETIIFASFDHRNNIYKYFP